MVTETMSVLEALRAVKTTDNKIVNMLSGATFVAANRQSAKKVNGILPEVFNDTAKQTYQSLMDITRRHEAIKGAISEYNAKTTVKIGDKTFTIAAALDYKKNGISVRNLILETLKRQLSAATLKCNHENGDKLENAVNQATANRFEGVVKRDSAEYLDFVRDYREQNQFVLVDPIDIYNSIAKLEDEINTFEANVDNAITTANAMNTITITY